MLRRISLVFLLLFSLSANALTFSDIKFGTKQFGDAQWNPTACITTTTCTSSAQAVGSLRNGNGQNVTPTSTQYLKFSYTNTDPAEPWTLTLYNSNGTVASVLGTYRIINAGQGYFMTSNAPHPQAGNGTLWSTQSGMVSGSKTYTEILQPTQAQMDSLADSYYSPDPIYVAGQTYTPPPPPYSSGITAAQQTRKTSETTQRTSQSGNEIQIEQIGDNNNITIRQGVTLGARNRIELYSNGNSNTLNINQGYTTNGTAVGGDGNNHYQYLHLTGNSNSVTTQQSGNGQFMENTVSGNNNTLNYTQADNGSKTLFSNVNGNTNTINATQSGTGAHYLDINMTGNGHSATVNQTGAGNHATTLDLTNAGGSSTVNVTQQGSTAQTYNLQQSCANAAGCSTTITQGQ